MNSIKSIHVCNLSIYQDTPKNSLMPLPQNSRPHPTIQNCYSEYFSAQVSFACSRT